MSGILAVVRTDGASVDGTLLQRLTGALSFRGPDGSSTRVLGSVGLGHARLALGRADGPAPATIDGRVWVTADARIDGRRELIGELRSLGIDVEERATDSDLILSAYEAWGDRCAEHLLGDFAFLIWDEARRRLLAVRDPFGVKLLYHAAGPGWLVVGNTLACVRAHPGVSARLDRSAVGNFLLWAENWDRGTTTFADVSSVPPGHRLSWTEGKHGVELHRYWSVPPEPDPPAPMPADDGAVLEEFRRLLDAAVDDRLSGGSATVLMSGGLDSPMIAAVARARLAASGPDRRLEALTYVYDGDPADPERHFAALAAGRIGIPIRQLASAADPGWGWLRGADAPEPALLGAVGPEVAGYREAAALGGVVLTGWDGDALLAADLGILWRRRLQGLDLGHLAREVGWHVRARRFPRVGARAALARWRDGRSVRAFHGYPTWLAPAFEADEDLRARWLASLSESGEARTVRGRSREWLATPVWRSVLDPADPGMSGWPIEQRHPLLDLRLVRFTLALPTVPWCVDKELFRAAMRNELPGPVLRRPKTPFAGTPGSPLAAELAPLLDELAPELAEYVDLARFRAVCADLCVAGTRTAPLASAVFNTLALSAWLGSRSRSGVP